MSTKMYTSAGLLSCFMSLSLLDGLGYKHLKEKKKKKNKCYLKSLAVFASKNSLLWLK